MLSPTSVRILLLGTLAAILSSCGGKSLIGKSKSTYREDLSKVRPRYTYVEPVTEKYTPAQPSQPSRKPAVKEEPPLHVNKRLEAILDTIAEQNRAIRYVNGYRIQIYVGNVRQEADAAKSFTYQTFPELNAYMSYSQPTYRVKVGDFMYRADAEQYLELVRPQYSTAIILSDRVEIKRSLDVKVSAETKKY
ncbi:hypothetical protein GCM10027275_02790 [Rhabdobacter roseus]|uniref:SPOR domain-containing protein n=1 Tax=Rhabdobacter roseus TaxID=1655419 RepID=A0A840TK40_9BACT|nr:SPOR domain-containing protein [Rhabdobacter roseus]MBB5282167.1 hypothetical protein [Rhabdobacter roseus]